MREPVGLTATPFAKPPTGTVATNVLLEVSNRLLKFDL